MYLVMDRYEMQKVVLVKYITLVHPTLTWLQKLVNVLTTAMQNANLIKVMSMIGSHAHRQTTMKRQTIPLFLPFIYHRKYLHSKTAT
jgi:hypothetical protein